MVAAVAPQPVAPQPIAALSAGDARRLALAAQRLIGAPDRRAGVAGVVRTLGAVQLDTISVLARSHELVAYARLGPVGRQRIETAYWGGGCFEYWAHAASILPCPSGRCSPSGGGGRRSCTATAGSAWRRCARRS